MMLDSMIGRLVAGAIVGLLVLLARTKRATPDGPFRVLKYSWLMQGLALSVLGLFVYLAWFSYEMNERATSTLVLASGLIFVGMCLVAEVWFSTVRFSEQELISVTPWHGMQRVQWESVVEISVDPQWNQIVVVDEIGTKVRVQRLFSGVAELVGAMRQRFPLGVFPSDLDE